ncbi:DUF4350 domain-containing protein [Alloalcanivorax mobilis]|uniref:DUF4350 domain-containing protein n=1 Tax=Alloalcanivorax mobilis TaxID=2019569 RepID=UPI000C794E5F|nr:DUF4350 domain-containing protein [Alloalcanivorax mobilis]
MKRAWPWLFALLLVAAVGGYFALTEPVRRVVAGELDASVRHNPYYAAQALLRQWGHDTRRVFSTRALFPLPDPGTTLVLDGNRGELGDDRVAELLRWVHRGGHLIVAARPVPDWDRDPRATAPQWRRHDPLLYDVGVTAHDKPADPGQTAAAPLDDLIDRFTPLQDLLLEYCLNNPTDEQRAQCERLTCEAPEYAPPATSRDLDTQPRRFGLDDALVLIHEPTGGADQTVVARADNDLGDKLVALRVGAGQVTVLTGLALWDNDHLLYFDHAWLLAALAGSGPVWFVQGIAMPPLPLWLWEHAWPPLLALLLALAFWLWRRLPRPGVTWQRPVAQGADYLGHLRALGHFHWRTGQARALIDPLQHQALRRIQLLHPDPDTALTLAAERLAVPPERLHQALAPPTREHAQWTERVALLQQIRSRL